MAADYLGPYRVAAFNTAHDSENKIHDDATARRFGFGGGLVPGVDVYGYMTHLPVVRWGRAWLERGTAECRFFKPVYDGETGHRHRRPRATAGSRSRWKAAASAARPAARHLPDAAAAGPRIDAFRKVAQRAERPPADEASLAAETWLGLDPYPITPEMAARYLADSRESAAIYAEEGLVHPRDILRSLQFRASAATSCWARGSTPAAASGISRRRAVGRHAVGARPRHRQLRAQGPSVRRSRRAGAGERSDAHRPRRAYRDLSPASDRRSRLVIAAVE